MSAPTPGRRGLLGGAAALLAGAAAVALPRAALAAGTGPDAALISLCAEFCEMQHMLWTIHDGPDAEPDEGMATAASMPLWGRQRALAMAILGSRAHTADGIVAVAYALASYASDGGFAIEPNPETGGGQLSTTLMRETLRLRGLPIPDRLLGRAAGPAAAVAAPTLVYISPDVEFIRLCDRLVAMQAEEAAILKMDPDAPDDGPHKPVLDALTVEWRAIDARLYDVADPVTKAGVLAAAKAAVAQAPKQVDGCSIDAPQLAEWLAFTVAEHVAREGVA